MAILDCFTYCNEAEVLEIRLHELAPVVDRFVIAEGTRDFRGRPRALRFPVDRQRAAAFADRITYVVVDDLPPTGHDEASLPRRERQRRAFARERQQRNALMRGLRDAAPTDLVLISDADEIPRASSVAHAAEILRRPWPRVVCFEQRMFGYRFNLEYPNRWLRSGPRMVRRHGLVSPQALRNVRAGGSPMKRLERAIAACVSLRRPVITTVLKDAGWHFTKIGDAAAVLDRLESYSHVSDNLSLRRVERYIGKRLAFVNDREVRLRARLIDDDFPSYLVRHRHRFAGRIAPSR
jgi:beta-1,4-mannosyl-glycoprotein beta-1,4-N-acetylglucosaminyltransferase